METRICYKCGKEKIAIGNKGDIDTSQIRMYKMGYGKHHGQFRCKNCKES